MITQVELELETYGHGRDRMRNSILAAEEAGRANDNPYAARLYREFLFPLRDLIAAELSEKKAGRRQAHAALLDGMDFDAVAILALRHGLQAAMGDISARAVAGAIGKSVYSEFLLTQFEHINPRLFHHLINDIDKRMSSDERYKMAVMRNQGLRHGVEFTEWAPSNVLQVGYYLVQKMVEVGLLEVDSHQQRGIGARGKMTHINEVQLTEEAAGIVRQISDWVVELAPYWTPCIEPPKDWTTNEDGGYHTDEMRSLGPYLVHHSTPLAREAMEVAHMEREFKCINALQRTAWRVNKRLLDVATNVSHHYDMEEVLMQGDSPQPKRPDFLDNLPPGTELSEEQKFYFKRWKREMATWYTDEKMRKVKGYRYDGTMRSARKFAQFDRLYFVYFMDFRGRKYVKTNGISPQGSDLQKALLEFAEGKPLLTQGAKDWFCITGANRFGIDKVNYADRIKWVKENEHLILDWARNPIDAPGWMKADKPFQFLAWCLEYAQWKVHGDKFLSRISVGMDGSCNGLQNFSAMLLDPVGGRAVNLLPSLLPNDIYQMVADRTTSLLQNEEEDEDGFRTMWLDHVLTRSLVKRSVMTLPYGSKRTSCKDFIIKDYLKAGKFPELPSEKYERAAAYLSFRVWAAIGDVVVKAREAMDWLQDSARRIIKQGATDLRWITPTGFPVTQCYWEVTEHRINTRLAGNTKIVLKKHTGKPNIANHKNGIAPNFVHSLDASHLTLTTVRCVDAGITSFHMVHDDYGTHAADAPALYTAIREEFVGMYQRHDMLQEFRDGYSFLPEPPLQGRLDITQVLDSPYFFG